MRSMELGHEGAALLGREGEANQADQKMEMTKLRQEAQRSGLAISVFKHPYISVTSQAV